MHVQSRGFANLTYCLFFSRSRRRRFCLNFLLIVRGATTPILWPIIDPIFVTLGKYMIFAIPA